MPESEDNQTLQKVMSVFTYLAKFAPNLSSVDSPTPSGNFWKMFSDTGMNRADIPLVGLIGNSSCAEILQPCVTISLRKA